ncbi:hypothetical protein, partial [Caldibacillus thermoamylovorans]|uniref:hypothetical protein n=1 Tax=Caldibacillus thermoamylovorans TaxID=35841 RepID=UPI0012E04705
MATRPLLVVILSRETSLFGDEIHSRRHFLAETSLFGDETHSRHLFEAENALFWRRDHFSSSLLLVKLYFLVTRLFLVVIFVRETP